MKSLILFCLSFVFCLNVNAQFLDNSIYLKGFIVTRSNDTIHGHIAYEEDYYGRVKYKLNPDDKENHKIPVKQIKYLKVSRDVFESIKYEKDSLLMRSIVKGEISFYKDIQKKQGPMMPVGPAVPVGSTVSAGMMMTSSRNKEIYYLVKEDRTIKIKKRKLQAVLKDLMNDYPKIYPEIDQLDTRYATLEYKLRDLLRKYNYRHR